MFHDGAKLDSQAVLTSFKRLQEINQGPASYLINIAGFDAPDPNTFVIKLSAPYSLFPGTVPWFLIASPGAITSNKTSSDPWSKSWFANKAAGTGPYMLDSIKPNNRIDMVQNKHYWRDFKAGVPTSVAIIQNANTTTQLELLQSGQTDFLSNIGPDNAETAKSLPNVSVVRQPAIQLRTIPLNMIRTPLTDVRVRQALIAAFDYDGYTNFYKGFGRPANSPIPPQFPGWDSSLPYAKQDLAKAKQLLDAAGVKQGTQMRMVTVQGLNYESFAGTIFQSALSKIGIDLKVEAPPWPQIPPQMANNASSPPMTFLNVFPNTPDPALVIRVSYHSSNIPSNGGQPGPPRGGHARLRPRQGGADPGCGSAQSAAVGHAEANRGLGVDHLLHRARPCDAREEGVGARQVRPVLPGRDHQVVLLVEGKLIVRRG